MFRKIIRSANNGLDNYKTPLLSDKDYDFNNLKSKKLYKIISIVISLLEVYAIYYVYKIFQPVYKLPDIHHILIIISGIAAGLVSLKIGIKTTNREIENLKKHGIVLNPQDAVKRKKFLLFLRAGMYSFAINLASIFVLYFLYYLLKI